MAAALDCEGTFVFVFFGKVCVDLGISQVIGSLMLCAVNVSAVGENPI